MWPLRAAFDHHYLMCLMFISQAGALCLVCVSVLALEFELPKLFTACKVSMYVMLIFKVVKVCIHNIVYRKRFVSFQLHRCCSDLAMLSAVEKWSAKVV